VALARQKIVLLAEHAVLMHVQREKHAQARDVMQGLAVALAAKGQDRLRS
jgi:hypothetical protein